MFFLQSPFIAFLYITYYAVECIILIDPKLISLTHLNWLQTLIIGSVALNAINRFLIQLMLVHKLFISLFIFYIWLVSLLLSSKRVNIYIFYELKTICVNDHNIQKHKHINKKPAIDILSVKLICEWFLMWLNFMWFTAILNSSICYFLFCFELNSVQVYTNLKRIRERGHSKWYTIPAELK